MRRMRLVSVLMALSVAASAATVLSRSPQPVASQPPGGAAAPADAVVPSEQVNGVAIGRTAGSGGVTDDGAAEYELPLWVPSGRTGMQPDLSLAYRSRSENGLLGVGWMLSGLPRITRCPRTFAQDGGARAVEFIDGNQGDRFCLDGKRLVAVAGPDGRQSAYGADGTEYRTEHDQHLKVVSYAPDALGPTYFKVFLKDGRILTLGGGGSSNSWVQGPRAHVDPAKIGLTPGGPDWPIDYSQEVRYAWALSRMEDRAGNYLTVQYGLASLPNHGLEQLPQLIAYTASARDASARATRTIQFSYEDRPDPGIYFIGGLRIEQRKRLARVDMVWQPEPGSSQLLKSYVLRYRNDTATRRSLLREVQECDGAGICLPPTKFDWSPDLSGTYSDVDTKIAVTLKANSWADQNPVLHVGDLDADGRDDIRYRDNTPGGGTTANCRLPASAGSIGCRHLPLNCFERGEGPEVQPDGRVIDVNGDSRADTIFLERDACDQDRTNPVNYINRIYLTLPDGGTSVLHDTVEQLQPYTKPLYELDMNGDGLPEFVHAGFSGYRLNTNGTPGDYLATGLPHSFSQSFKGLAADVDGSGRASLLVQTACGFVCGSASALTLDSGTPMVKPLALLLDRTGYSHPLFMDVNGDGLSDWVSLGLKPGALNVSINTGNGFMTPEPWTIPPPYSQSPSVNPLYTSPNPFTANPSTDLGARVIDYNQDGRQDLLLMAGAPDPNLHLNTLAVLLSTGTGFQPISLPPHIPVGANVNLFGETQPGDFRGWKLSQTLDANGDGLDDFIQVANGNFHVYIRGSCTGGASPLCQKNDLLVGITDGLGAKESFEYASVADSSVYTPGKACDYPQTCATRGIWVVKRHQVSAPGTLTRRSLRYSYADGRSDLTGRGWLGFARRVETDEVTGRFATTTFDNETRVAGFYPCLGIPRLDSTDVPLSGGMLRRRAVEVTCQAVTGNNDRTYFAYPARREVRESEGPAADRLVLLRRGSSGQTQDPYGNVTASEALTYAVRDGEATGRAHKLQVAAEFDNFDASWLIGQEARRQVTSTTRTGRSVTRTTAYDYDPDTGLVVTMTVEPEVDSEPDADGAALPLRTTLERNQYGLIIAITRAGSSQARTERLDYDDTDHLFPKVTTDPAGHSDRFAWHQGLGLLTSRTDANGVTARFQYDWLGRIRFADSPDGADVTTHYLADPGGQPKNTISMNGGMTTDVYLDRYGREFAREWLDFAGSRVRSEVAYDDVGRPASVAHPHAVGAATPLETFHYDNLGRLLTASHPDATSQVQEYRGLQTIQRDEKGNRRILSEDELGRVQSTADELDGRLLRTSFDYGPFDVLVGITGPDGHRSSMAYDSLGRRTLLTDPDSGRHVTRYNAFGEVEAEVDAKMDRTSYTRDQLGRPRTITTGDGTTTFTWDTAAQGVGKLAESRSPDGVQTRYLYDSLSRLRAVSSTLAGASYAVDFTYTQFGRLDELTYPTVPGRPRLKVKYTYTPRGDLQSIQDPVTHRAYWTAQARNPRGQPTGDILGNGVMTTRRYDDRGRLRFIDSKAPASAAPLQALEYQYEDNGNMARRYDHARHVLEEFSYDGLDRLIASSLGRGRAKKLETIYGYSDDGNINSQTVVDSPGTSMTYTYGEHGAGPHAVSGVTTGGKAATYAYDPDGNQTRGPRRTIDYTSFGLPSVIKTPRGATRFAYDAFHHRALKQHAKGGSTVYLEGLYEKRTNAANASHVFFIAGDEGPIAQVIWSKTAHGFGPDKILYLHHDGLGSTETVSGANAQAVAHLDYSPFGIWHNDGSTGGPLGQPPADVRLGFTGHEHDGELGLINMQGRMYDPGTGRFLSPDTLIPGGGQALNPYSYAENNPATFTDPTGFQTEGSGHQVVTFSEAESAAAGGHITGHVWSGGSCPGTCGGGSENPSVGSSPRVADDNGTRLLPRQQNPVGPTAPPPESTATPRQEVTDPQGAAASSRQVAPTAESGCPSCELVGEWADAAAVDSMTAKQLAKLMDEDPTAAEAIFREHAHVVPRNLETQEMRDIAEFHRMMMRYAAATVGMNAGSLGGMMVKPRAPFLGIGVRRLAPRVVGGGDEGVYLYRYTQDVGRPLTKGALWTARSAATRAGAAAFTGRGWTLGKPLYEQTIRVNSGLFHQLFRYHGTRLTGGSVIAQWQSVIDIDALFVAVRQLRY
jgi:RHS repeat-associated protein